MQLMFKSILVLRRVHEFLRLTKTLAVPDAQESGEFRRLDALLSSFRQSLPAEYRSAVRYQLSQTGTGQHTLDLDTLMCHVCSLRYARDAGLAALERRSQAGRSTSRLCFRQRRHPAARNFRQSLQGE